VCWSIRLDDAPSLVLHRERKLDLSGLIPDPDPLIPEIEDDRADLTHKIGSDDDVVTCKKTCRLARHQEAMRIRHAGQKQSSCSYACPLNCRVIGLNNSRDLRTRF